MLKYIYLRVIVTMINHSISIRPSDVDNIHIVKTIKQYCKSKGVSFSYIVLKALKKYYNEIINGQL